MKKKKDTMVTGMNEKSENRRTRRQGEKVGAAGFNTLH